MVTEKNVYVAIAAYLTQARPKINEYLSKLGMTVVYCDTDSVIYIPNVDEPPKVETGLSDRTHR